MPRVREKGAGGDFDQVAGAERVTCCDPGQGWGLIGDWEQS